MVTRPVVQTDKIMAPFSRLRPLLPPLALLALAILLLVGLPRPSMAQSNGGSILIWPVGPVIEADKRAAALWLENPGSAPVTLQVRVYGWAQVDGKNAYAPQDAILGTPPIVSIAPGAKQLIRLTRTVDTPAGTEAAYRVVVDEIPAARSPAETGAAVSFRMRYSLPLFAYGPGLASPDAQTQPAQRQGSKQSLSEGKAALPRSGPPESGPILDWRTGTDAEGRFLEIRNRGALHARLTDVGFGPADGIATSSAGAATVAKGLFGYVLPGATMRWPLVADAPASAFGAIGTLVAAINGAAAAPIERRRD
jgi:fimbrial chaperone protein